jgi:hypothetical protein
MAYHLQAILPCHFALAAPRGARALEIQIESAPLGDFAENVANEHLEAVPDDLSPAMSE